MNHRHALALLLFSGCAVDTAEDLSVETAAVSKEPIDDPPPTTTQPPAPPPPESSRVVRLSSAELQSALGLFLGGRLLTVDTTGVSPPRLGPSVNVCTWPNAEAREQATAECHQLYVGSALFQCLKQVNVDWPNISECHLQPTTVHSYIDFNSFAESNGASDVLFDVAPIVKDTWAGTYTFNINELKSDTSAAISAYFTINRSAYVWLPLTSRSPTLICTGGWGCPDVSMWNMRMLLRFTDIRPGAAYSCTSTGTPPACSGPDTVVGARLGFSSARPTFYFDRNISYLPDPIVDLLFDTDAAIRDAAEGKLYDALTTTAGHAAVSKAITNIALNRIRNTTHPTIRGFAHIVNTWYDAGQLVIEYDWY